MVVIAPLSSRRMQVCLPQIVGGNYHLMGKILHLHIQGTCVGGSGSVMEVCMFPVFILVCTHICSYIHPYWSHTEIFQFAPCISKIPNTNGAVYKCILYSLNVLQLNYFFLLKYTCRLVIMIVTLLNYL